MAVKVRGRQTDGRSIEVTLDGAVIADVRDTDPSAEDPWLAPGFIDLQVNGFGGHDVNGADVSPAGIAAMVSGLQAVGTTTFVPTIVTASADAICASLSAIAAARQDPVVAQAIPFAHVEGPFLSDQDGPRGVHALDQIREPSVAEVDEWQKAGDGLVGIITVSPHWPGSADFIAAMVARGIRVAIGHTHASPEQIRAAVDAGATLCTHLGNGAHALVPRHPNYIWTQLADDRLTAGLIADGHHLPGDTLKAMIRAKTPERVVLVTDAVALAGMPPGDYVQPVGGTVRLEPNGRLGYIGTPFLAGSVAILANCVAFTASAAEVGLATAVACATTNPARVIGAAAADRAVIAPGRRADLVAFDWAPGDTTVSLRQTWVAR